MSRGVQAALARESLTLATLAMNTIGVSKGKVFALHIAGAWCRKSRYINPTNWPLF